jgi:hypothetical protein
LFCFIIFNPPSLLGFLLLVSFSSAVDHAIANTFRKPFIKEPGDGSETMRVVAIERFMTGLSRKKIKNNTGEEIQEKIT